MRVTLVLDDGLLREAEVRAARQNLTLSDIVDRALRETLDREEPEAPAFSRVTYGRGGSSVDHEPADLAAEFEREDRSRVS